MLELTPPLWLFTTRPGDTPVPDSERCHLGDAIRSRIDGATSSSSALVLSSRLIERVRDVGQFSTEAEEIVRSALRELGLAAPLRITVTDVDEWGRGHDASIVFDGAGFPLEESPTAVDPETHRFGAIRCERWMRGFVRSVGERLLRIARSELDAVVAALHEKYRGDAGPRAMRAATRLLARYVDARSDHSFHGDAAAQIAWLVLEFAKQPHKVAFVIEAMPQRTGVEGILLSRHPATGHPGPIVEACAIGSAGVQRVRDWTELIRIMGSALDPIEAQLRRAEVDRGRVVGVRFDCEVGEQQQVEVFDTELSPLARIRTAFALEQAGALTRERALSSLADLEDLALRIPIRVDDEVIAPLALARVASVGVRSGRLALCADQAARYRRAGYDVILAFESRAKPPLLDLALGRGVLLIGGGIDSESARASRRIGVPALVFDDAEIDRGRAELVIGDEFVREGDPVTLDAWTGALFVGELPLVDRVAIPDSEVIARWRAEEAPMKRICEDRLS